MKMSLWPHIGNKKLNPKQIRIHTLLEIVAVKISEPIQMIVVSVYRPPSTPVDVFMNHMLQIIAQFQHVPTCIIGDFNEDVSITSNTHCVQCWDHKPLSKWSVNWHIIVEQS